MTSVAGLVGTWAGVLLLSAVPVMLQAQTGTVTGRVVDSTTQQGIVGANVQVVGTTIGTQTRRSTLSATAHLLRVAATGDCSTTSPSLKRSL